MKKPKKLNIKTPIVVLADGTTWTALENCHVMFVSDRQLKKLDEGLEPDDLSKKTEKIKITELLKQYPYIHWYQEPAEPVKE
jgi:hypothetical protein